MILLVDNYDSFVYNLYQYLLILGEDVRVVRNDEISVADVKALKPQAIVISPGPCSPKEAGQSVAIIKECYRTIPILGICLGHQCLADAFGANVVRAQVMMHGKTSFVKHNNHGVFKGLINPLQVMRYHSLVADDNTIPDDLEITAVSQDDGEIMGLRHKHYLVEGIQFHPESIMTPQGMDMLKNFLTELHKRKDG